MHRYLEHPDRARAYAHLIEHPIGTLRAWATALGWTTGKVQRFIASLSRYRLGEIVADKHGTTFRPLGGEKVHRFGASACIDVHRCASAPNQEPCTGLIQPRFRPRPIELQEGTAELVAVMNGILCRNHPMSYLPVRVDNYGSNRAAKRWLIELEIPLADAIEMLTRKAQAFNPAKVNGEMPRSLGFFTKSVVAEWRRILRDRQQLGLFPKMNMQLERSSIDVAPALPQSKPEPERPTAAPETLSAVMTRLAEVRDMEDEAFLSLKPGRL